MTLRSDAGAELKSFIEQIERLGVERKELGDEQRALFAAAKSKGLARGDRGERIQGDCGQRQR